MDKYILLFKYTPDGAKHANPKDAQKRRKVMLKSLKETLKGREISNYVTMGKYDSLSIIEVPEGHSPRILQCLFSLRSPGDLEVTVLRAFEFAEIFGDTAKP